MKRPIVSGVDEVDQDHREDQEQEGGYQEEQDNSSSTTTKKLKFINSNSSGEQLTTTTNGGSFALFNNHYINNNNNNNNNTTSGSLLTATNMEDFEGNNGGGIVNGGSTTSSSPPGGGSLLIKREDDYLDQQAIMLEQGVGNNLGVGDMSSSDQEHHQENNNDSAKKVKLNGENGSGSGGSSSAGGSITENGGSGLGGGGHPGGNNGPSRVVHIRNIPSDVSETEIVHLGIPFGRVTNVLVLKGKNQAFLELAEESAAVAMVSYFTNCVAQLRGRSVYVQFSTHKELKTDQSHSNANSAAQAALAAAAALVVSSSSSSSTPSTTFPQQQNSNENGTSNNSSSSTQGGPNTVLRVIIEQMLYPVTLDVLHQIFSRMGKVLRIVTFTKNNFFQALIQYPDVVMAQAAKLSLDGQNIYNGCCTLRIEYSKLSSLNVRYNNDKSRDYTNPNLPTGESNAADLVFGVQGQNGVLGNFQAQQQQLAALLGSVNGHHPLNHQHPGFLAAMGLGGSPGSGVPNSSQYSRSGSSSSSILAAVSSMTPAAMAAAAMGIPTSGHPHHGNNNMPGCVLLVSNLNEELITPDGLFTLFGVYGDVQRVKILFNKKDSALVQMREPAQAQLALTYLDRLKLYGKMIRVTLSKHGLVQMPKEGQPDAGLTKDYTNSPLHRFKKPDSKNYQNIYAPSATLHLSNIPASVSDEEITTAFTEAQFNVKGFKFFPKDRKMALLQLPSIEEAAEALIKMHNHQLRENSHLRVSFSKSTI